MLKQFPLDLSVLDERIRLHARRLTDDYYQMPEVFQPADSAWPGDKEGRALLAFVSHYKMTGEKNPCMEALLAAMPEHTNAQLYFGPDCSEETFEQQLSGHSWVLRGLCEHYEQFGDAFSLKALTSITEHLFLPTRGRYASYPVNRDSEYTKDGGVGGHSAGTLDGWILSTDVGCAFMSVDGLSHVYKITRDARVKELLDEMITVYSGIDKAALRVQTHCTLTAARGMMRMYAVCGDEGYLKAAKAIYDLYTVGGGMDAVYQNLNWWGRPDSWTEPCAIVDSLMLAGQLYEATGEEAYRRMAARIYHNGLATSQRGNGGAGTDSLVVRKQDFPDFHDQPNQYMTGYEAPFCCTMRLAEGLWYVKSHPDYFAYSLDLDEKGGLLATKDSTGRYLSGDILLCEPSIDPRAAREQQWELPAPAVEKDGHKLLPLIRYYRLPDGVSTVLCQRILFD